MTLLISMLLVDCINMVQVKQYLALFMASEWSSGGLQSNRETTSASCLVGQSLSILPRVLQMCGWVGGPARAEDRASGHPAQGTELSA